MAAKKIERREMKGLRAWSRRVALAYLGAFGVASDEIARLFERFVQRGERVEKNVRKMVRQNGKEARHLAHELQKEQKAAAAKANKSFKKAVKKVEALA
jgi:hypothetical protein